LGRFLVSPFSSLIDTRGRASGSFEETMTFRARPVTSSSCSAMVTPSTMSPNFTRPATSVMIGIE
jgi:hypothetical protein